MGGIARIALLAALVASTGAVPHAARAVCGDGVLEPETEECDDGNTLHHDGCNPSCQIRYCVEPPPTGCIMARRASLRVREHGEGAERTGTLKIELAEFEEDAALADFGDPVFDLTRYDVCIYGDVPTPYAFLLVSRGFQTCGGETKKQGKEKACWQVSRQGYRYNDPDWRSSGVTTMELAPGAAGEGRIRIAAKRTKKKNRLPLVSQNLKDDTIARIRMMNTDGRCFGADLSTIQVNTGDIFRASTP